MKENTLKFNLNYLHIKNNNLNFVGQKLKQMSSKKINLEQLVDDTEVDAALIFNNDGILTKSIYLELAENYAAMSGILTTMSIELLQDLKLGNLDEIILNTDLGLFFIKKIDKNEYLGLVSKSASKMAIIHMKLQKLLLTN